MAEPQAPPPAPAPETVQMFDPATGSAVAVPVAQAADAYRAGAATFAADQTVPVVVDGRVVQMSGERAAAYLQTPEGMIGGGVVGQGDVAAQAERDRLDTVGHQAAALAIGAGRGLTLGLSDAFIRDAGGAAYMQAQERVNPGALLAGELAGAVAPLFVTGGGSAAVEGGALATRGAAAGVTAARAAEGASLAARGLEAATVLPRAVGRLGEAAGGLVERGVVGLGAVEGGLASRALGSAARGAVEGSLYGVGQEITRASVADENLAIEKLFAAAGHGALVGGALGGALTAGGALATKVGEKAADLAASLAGSTPKQLLSEMAQRKAIQATGANLGQIEKLAAKGPDVEARVARQMLEDVPAIAGKKSLAQMSKAEMVDAVAANVDKWGKEIGSKLKELDEIAAKGLSAEAKIDVAAVASKARAEVLGGLEAMPGREAQATWVRNYVDQLETKGAGAGFERLHELRRDLDKQIRFDKLGTDPLTDARLQMRNLLEDELVTKGERAATEAGAEFAARYKLAKEEYQAAAWAREATEKGAKAEARNRTLGLSEHLGMVSGSNAVGAALGSVAGPVGTLAGNAIGGLVGAAVQNYARRYGDQVAATLASRALKQDAVRAVAATVDDVAGGKIAAWLGTQRTRAPGAAVRDVLPAVALDAERASDRSNRGVKERFERKVQQIAAFRAAPQERVQQTFAAVAGASPTLTSGLVSKAVEASDFLAAKQPPALSSQNALQPSLRPPTVPDGEMSKFLRYADAVENPLGVLDDAREGRLSREGVEALKTVYPAMYAELQQQVSTAVATSEKPLSYTERLQLGTLLDLPVDASLTPEFMRAYQTATFTVTTTARPPSMTKKPEIAQDYSARTEVLEARREIGS